MKYNIDTKINIRLHFEKRIKQSKRESEKVCSEKRSQQ
jgi:hypothetical protein